MIIDCIADLHGYYPKLEGGDLLIIAGDLHARESWGAYLDFQRWLNEQDYKEIIIVAGNHDTLIQDSDVVDDLLYEHTYLCDSGTEFEWLETEDTKWGPKHLDGCRTLKLKIWGSPWTTRFEGMNPNCMAFTVDTDEELAEKWKLIPNDIDILITHSPPYEIVDMTRDKRHVGSISLRNEIMSRIKQDGKLLNIFGHIHECGGLKIETENTVFINASHVNERYEPVNKPVRLEL